MALRPLRERQGIAARRIRRAANMYQLVLPRDAPALLAFARAQLLPQPVPGAAEADDRA